MSSTWLLHTRFHLRRLLQTQPLALYALLGAGVLLVACIVMAIAQWNSADTAAREWQSLGGHAGGVTRPTSFGNGLRPLLPEFNNTQLVDALNSVAAESKLDLDEVSFVLDENVSEPYLRYHATLTVSSSYPTIRRFLDQVRVRQPDVLLDAISCAREDITTVDLTCDLTLSAFYRKDRHG